MEKYKVFYLLLGYVLIVSMAIAQSTNQPTPKNFIRPVYEELPLGSIQPEGWLKNQLEIMLNGSTGHLDETYNKLKNNNGWLGGKGEAGEETPYWLDGAVPLAYLLNDKILQSKVLKYINWILENQRPSGYFGAITEFERLNNTPVTEQNIAEAGDDWWPKMLMLKVIKQYYEYTKDERVILFMRKYFQFQLHTLKSCPIGKWSDWATSRGADNVMIVQWLYLNTGEPWLIELSDLIASQSFQWSDWFLDRDWIIGTTANQNRDYWMRRHGVNVGMALKSPAIDYQRTGDPKYLKAIKTGFSDLMTVHGLPFGIFSSDEDLHGNDPSQGAELCAIVESMFSMEVIASLTGDPFYLDALERMAFNALPSQTTDDYNNKQYFQIANQVNIKKGIFNFSTPMYHELTNVLGTCSGYTCCLANMHQGWTKFAGHLWYKTISNGVSALAYSPNTLKTTVGKTNQAVEITENTSYPFDETIRFELKTNRTVDFQFDLRIPGWCDEAAISINGKNIRTEKGGQIITIDRTWANGDVLTLELPMKVKISNWGRNSRTVERGPLVYALKISELWEKGQDEIEGDYFSVYATSDWNYGLLKKVIEKPEENLSVKKTNPVEEHFIWNLAHVPIEIRTFGKKIPSWKIFNDVAPQPVNDRGGEFKGKVNAQTEEITLVPIGFTKVRIVAFPVVP